MNHIEEYTSGAFLEIAQDLSSTSAGQDLKDSLQIAKQLYQSFKSSEYLVGRPVSDRQKLVIQFYNTLRSSRTRFTECVSEVKLKNTLNLQKVVNISSLLIEEINGLISTSNEVLQDIVKEANKCFSSDSTEQHAISKKPSVSTNDNGNSQLEDKLPDNIEADFNESYFESKTTEQFASEDIFVADIDVMQKFENAQKIQLDETIHSLDLSNDRIRAHNVTDHTDEFNEQETCPPLEQQLGNLDEMIKQTNNNKIVENPDFVAEILVIDENLKGKKAAVIDVVQHLEGKIWECI